MKKKLILFIIVCCRFCFLFSQQASIDTSFGDTGIVHSTALSFSAAHEVILQPDGKIIAVGDTRDSLSLYSFAIARFHINGDLDTSFHFDGMAEVTIDSNDCWAYDAALQNDGKIVVAGVNSTSGSYQFALARLNTNGTLDITFGNNGVVATNLGSSSEAFAVAIQNDGKILVGGTTNPNNQSFAIVRYNPDGSLDNSFDGDGFLINDYSPNNDAIHDLVLQPDGKILAAGYIHTFSGRAFAVARYNTNGSADNSFSGDGMDTAIFNVADIANCIAVQTDGKIVLVGHSFNNVNEDFAVARYNANGTLDNSFDGDGKLTTSIRNFRDVANSVTIQNDGKIVVVGFSQAAISGEEDYALVRYNIDGSIDATTNSTGIVITDISTDYDEAHSVVVQPNQDILVTGFSIINGERDFGLIRYLAGLYLGVLHFSDHPAVLVYPNPIHEQAIFTYTLDEKEIISIYVQDMHGKTVKTILSDQHQIPGEHLQEISLVDLSSGNYFLVISSVKGNAVVKIIKE